MSIQPRNTRVILGAKADARAEAALPPCCDDGLPCWCDDDDAGCYSCCPGCEWCADAPTSAPWLPTLAEVARVYDPAQRAAEKQAARDRYAEALRSGQKTVADLRAANGLVQVRGRIREFR